MGLPCDLQVATKWVQCWPVSKYSPPHKNAQLQTSLHFTNVTMASSIFYTQIITPSYVLDTHDYYSRRNFKTCVGHNSLHKGPMESFSWRVQSYIPSMNTCWSHRVYFKPFLSTLCRKWCYINKLILLILITKVQLNWILFMYQLYTV